MDTKQYFIEPLDVLFLRGNKLFGDPGSFGESLVPPRPSVIAGALRSALLVHKGYDLVRFADEKILDDDEVGTPKNPGSFRLTAFHLARRFADGTVEALFLPPADLVISRKDNNELETRRLVPHMPTEGILSSAVTQRLGILPQAQRAKTAKGMWLTAKGWDIHLQGKCIEPDKHLISSEQLWSIDTRVGIGLDTCRRRADEGKLFTVQAVVPRKMEHWNGAEGDAYDVGFVAVLAGADLPEQLTLRLGGDGRVAFAHITDANVPAPDYDSIAKSGSFRLVLTTPGCFEGGWLPVGVKGEGRDLFFDLHGVKARLTCAAVPRAGVVSGFDLAEWNPKPALRAAPAGSVYWLEESKATPDALRKLVESGLWPESSENTSRRAEGFNLCTLAAY